MEKIKAFKKNNFSRFLRRYSDQTIQNFLSGHTHWDAECISGLSDMDFFWFYKEIQEVTPEVPICKYLSEEALAYSFDDLNDENSQWFEYVQLARNFRRISSDVDDGMLTFGQARENLRGCFKSLSEKAVSMPEIFGIEYENAYRNIDSFTNEFWGKEDREFCAREVPDSVVKQIKNIVIDLKNAQHKKEVEKKRTQKVLEDQEIKKIQKAEEKHRNSEIEDKRRNLDLRDSFTARISRLDTENFYSLEGSASKKILTPVDWFHFALSIDCNAKPSDIKISFQGAVLEILNPKIRAYIEGQIQKSPKSEEGRVAFPNRRADIDLNHCNPSIK